MPYASAGVCTTVALEGAASERVCTHGAGEKLRALRAETTLARMVRIVRASVSNPQVWRVARRIVGSANSRNQRVQALAIRKWCLKHYRYVRDPKRVELLQQPAQLLREIARYGYFVGDCDEASLLTAALCTAVGIRCELHAVSFRANSPLSHVFAIAYPDGAAPVELDIVRPPEIKAPQTFPETLRARV